MFQILLIFSTFMAVMVVSLSQLVKVTTKLVYKRFLHIIQFQNFNRKTYTNQL